MSKGKARLLKYGITGAIGLIAAVALAISRGLFAVDNMADRYRLISDAFFIPGILLLFFGLLTWLSQEGAFNGISYAMRSLVRLVIPWADRESYQDYLARKKESGKGGFGFLIIVGGVYLLLSTLFLILHTMSR